MGERAYLADEQRAADTAVIWFRRDLRLHDHPALTAAVRAYRRVIPLFVFDDALLHGRWPAPNRLWFMRESVRLLDEALHRRGSALCYRRGRPDEVVTQFAAEVGASAVLVTRDYSPYGRRRDAAVAAALRERGIGFSAKRGQLVHEPEDVVGATGGTYTVFGPYRRRWEGVEVRSPLPAPAEIPPLPEVAQGALPTLVELGCAAPTARDIPAPGEEAARDRLASWVREGLDDYDHGRDDLGAAGSSRLSQDLRWGLLSPVEVLARCRGEGAGPAVFRSELCWRDFYHQILFHHPRLVREPFQANFAAVRWGNDAVLLAAWQEGRTGYPVVDAAMRQLVALGWMHNRARMIVASFLTKHLLIDYRHGEAFFMRHLTDGDLSANNGGWQWAASVGTDAQPYFRIFNPTLQGKRYDPDGNYVREWVPELAGVPPRYLHEPWTMPQAVQREAGCLIGQDYPGPIVDHAQARALALATFGAAKRGDGG